MSFYKIHVSLLKLKIEKKSENKIYDFNEFFIIVVEIPSVLGK